MIAILLLYVFTTGPAFWAWENVFGRSEEYWRTLWIIYSPVGIACEFERWNAAISWWVSVWCGDHP